MRCVLYFWIALILAAVPGLQGQEAGETTTMTCDDVREQLSFQLYEYECSGTGVDQCETGRKTQIEDMYTMLHDPYTCDQCQSTFNGATFTACKNESCQRTGVNLEVRSVDYENCIFTYQISEVFGISVERFTLGLGPECVVTSGTNNFELGDNEHTGLHGLSWDVPLEFLAGDFTFQLAECYESAEPIDVYTTVVGGSFDSLPGGICGPQCVPPPSPSPVDCSFREGVKYFGAGFNAGDENDIEATSTEDNAGDCMRKCAQNQNCKQYVYTETMMLCQQSKAVYDGNKALSGYTSGQCPAASFSPSTSPSPAASRSVLPSTTPQPTGTPSRSHTPSVSPYGCEDTYNWAFAFQEEWVSGKVGGKDPSTCKAYCQGHEDICKAYVSDDNDKLCYMLSVIPTDGDVGQGFVSGICPIPDPTPTASSTPAASRTSTLTPTKSITSTPMVSRTPLESFSRVPSPSNYPSITPAISDTRAQSSSPAPTGSPSHTGTRMPSSTPARSVSISASVSREASPSATRTKTAFPSRSAEPSSSRGESPTPHPSASVDPSSSRYPTRSAASSPSSSASYSRYPSTTPARSDTPTVSKTPVSSLSPTISASPANSPSATTSYTPVASASRPASPSLRPSTTNTASISISRTRAPSKSNTGTRTASATYSKTPFPSTAPIIPTSECRTLTSCSGVEFNALVFKDFSGSSDSRGRLFVGGDAYLESYSVGEGLPQSNGQRDDLVVGGSLNFVAGTVGRGNIVYGKNTTVGTEVMNSMSLNNIIKSESYDFVSAETCMSRLSYQLITTVSGGGKMEVRTNTGISNMWFFKTTPVDEENKLDIYNIYCHDLENIASVNFDNVPQDATTIINVLGTECMMDAQMIHPNPRKVIWNFPDATTLTLGEYIEGSILAPTAAVQSSATIKGQLCALSFEGAGSLDIDVFNGCIPI